MRLAKWQNAKFSKISSIFKIFSEKNLAQKFSDSKQKLIDQKLVAGVIHETEKSAKNVERR